MASKILANFILGNQTFQMTHTQFTGNIEAFNDMPHKKLSVLFFLSVVKKIIQQNLHKVIYKQMNIQL